MLGALARNAFTKKRIQEDFQMGLEEMASMASDKAKEALRDFYLPVFTVSSMVFSPSSSSFSFLHLLIAPLISSYF